MPCERPRGFLGECGELFLDLVVELSSGWRHFNGSFLVDLGLIECYILSSQDEAPFRERSLNQISGSNSGPPSMELVGDEIVRAKVPVGLTSKCVSVEECQLAIEIQERLRVRRSRQDISVGNVTEPFAEEFGDLR